MPKGQEHYLTVSSHRALKAAITNVELALYMMKKAHRTWRQEELPHAGAALSDIGKAIKGYGYLVDRTPRRTRR